MSGTLLTRCSTSPDSAYPINFEEGSGYVDCDFPTLSLSAGTYILGFALSLPNIEWLDNQLDTATMTVEPRDVFAAGLAPSATRYPISMPHVWSYRRQDALPHAR